MRRHPRTWRPQAIPAVTSSTRTTPGSDSDSDYDADDQDSNYGQPALVAQTAAPAAGIFAAGMPRRRATCGRRAIGAIHRTVTTGCRERGHWPRQVGYLWTPGYWGYTGGRYRYHKMAIGAAISVTTVASTMGLVMSGAGYQGGYWNGDRFDYNRSVNNVNSSNVQVYNRTITNTVIINNTTVSVTNSRASYNGPGGVTRKPLPAEVAATREQRIPPMNTQMQHRQHAAQNRQQFASVNKGRPTLVADAKPIAAGKPIAPGGSGPRRRGAANRRREGPAKSTAASLGPGTCWFPRTGRPG